MEEVVGSEEDPYEMRQERNMSKKMERFSNLEIFNSAQMLLSVDEMGNLKVVDQVLDEIRQINATLNIVGICGPYRSGKSFLANAIIGERGVFEIGHSTDFQTKGVWVKCIRHPIQTGQILMVLETEGFGNAQTIQLTDNYLFTLTFLLSSTLIYNTFGFVNMDLLDKLKIVTKLPNHCHMIENASKAKSKELLPFISPTFVVCLRDYYLQRSKDCGTPDDYFESFLREKSHRGSEDYDKSRQCIRTYFPVRRCFLIDRPTANEKLNKLNTLNAQEFDCKFRENMNELKQYVLSRPFKCLANMTRSEEKPIGGLVFESLLTTFVSELQAHKQIGFDRVFENAAEKHNTRVLEIVKCKTQDEMDDIEKKLPITDEGALVEDIEKIRRSCLQKYRSMSYLYRPDMFENTLMEVFTDRYKNLYWENRCVILMTCYNGLVKITEEILLEKSIIGKYQISKSDILLIEQKYRKRTSSVKHFEEREEALEQFKRKLETDRKGSTQKNTESSRSGIEAKAIERMKIQLQEYFETEKDRNEYYHIIKIALQEKVPEKQEREEEHFCSEQFKKKLETDRNGRMEKNTERRQSAIETIANKREKIQKQNIQEDIEKDKNECYDSIKIKLQEKASEKQATEDNLCDWWSSMQCSLSTAAI